MKNTNIAKLIYCDFDGTITNRDTIDHLLELYAKPEWEVIEEDWKNGLIGSRECLEKQIACIPHFTKSDFNSFLSQVTIDPHFPEFYNYVLNAKIPFYVISDGFDLIIESVFKKYDLTMPVIYSNNLKFDVDKDKLITHFPKSNAEACLVKAGMCKCSIIEKEKISVTYIGDGRSDLCASRLATSLYAKGKLQTLCDEQQRSYIPFTNFKTITNELFQ